MTISKLASDVAENHWETKGMKHALQAERDYNLMTTQKLERLKVRNVYSLGVGSVIKQTLSADVTRKLAHFFISFI